ncbi:MAG: 2-hydroxyacid dehydrogenase [Vicinamibacterales bacterium]|nr:2-hydroxyacid dehydrogenase [Vicinamibacterales bacterium]
MRIAFFDTHAFDREAFTVANARFGFDLTFFEARLTAATAALASGFPVVCPFVNDRLDADALQTLHAGGVRLIALRSAGYNHVDLAAAADLALPVVRVPEYSPHAVAEHAVALLLALNRKIPRAANRVRDANFSLDGLVGFDLYGRTVGIVGTGRIGVVMATIMLGFGCRVVAFDMAKRQELIDRGVSYVNLTDLYRVSDVISLHVPLTPKTHHLIDAAALQSMKRGVMIINTGRGALIDTPALVEALKQGQVGAAGLDVYEEEEGLFFRDLSDQVLQDDVLARLLTFPNVLITAHQAFLTQEALANIAQTTLESVRAFEQGRVMTNLVPFDGHAAHSS